MFPTNSAFGIPSNLNVGGGIARGTAAVDPDEVPQLAQLAAVEADLTAAIASETAVRVAADLALQAQIVPYTAGAGLTLTGQEFSVKPSSYAEIPVEVDSEGAFVDTFRLRVPTAFTQVEIELKAFATTNQVLSSTPTSIDGVGVQYGTGFPKLFYLSAQTTSSQNGLYMAYQDSTGSNVFANIKNVIPIQFPAFVGKVSSGTNAGRVFAISNNIATEIARVGTVQPINSNLTTIAGLSAANGDFMVRQSGAWASRSVAQVQADLAVGTAVQFGSRTVLELAAITPQANIFYWCSNEAGGACLVNGNGTNWVRTRDHVTVS